MQEEKIVERLRADGLSAYRRRVMLHQNFLSAQMPLREPALVLLIFLARLLSAWPGIVQSANYELCR